MTKLQNFKDGSAGCFSNIRMDNNDPCFISVAQTGVIVKKSKLGIMGSKLYSCNDIYTAANTAKALHYLYPDNTLPDGFLNPVLKSFTNAVMHCSRISEVVIILNEAIQNAEKQSGLKISDLNVAP